MNEHENNGMIPEESESPVSPVAIAEQPAAAEPSAPQTAPEAAAPESYFESKTVTPSTPLPGKKIPVAVIVIIAVAVIALIAVGAVAAVRLLEPEPREAVERAWAASAKAGEDEREDFKKQYPLYAAVFGDETATAKTGSFEFTLQELDGVEGARMVANILRGTGIRVDYSADPAAATAEFTGELLLTGEPLVDLYGYFSPTMAAANVPSFSDTVLSVDLETFAEDFKNSVLYDGSVTDEQLEQIEAVFVDLNDYIKVLSGADSEQMLSDLMEICGQAVANAAFTKGEDDGDYKTYLISVPGADVKKMVSDLLRYIYLDSETGRAIMAMQQPLTGDGYEQQINELITGVDEIFPELPVNISLSVDNKRVIRSAVVSAVLDGTSLCKKLELTVDGNPRGIFSDVSFVMEIEENGALMTVEAGIVSRDENDVYTSAFDMEMNIEGMLMTMSVPITMSKDGAVSVEAELAMESSGVSEAVFSLDCSGNVTEEGERTVLDLPGSSVVVGTGEEEITVGFDLRTETAPLSSPIAGPAQHTPLFSMSEQQMEELVEEYEQGVSGLVGTAYSILMAG